MTDETTARDRAIELIEDRIDRGQVRDVHLHNALRTLLPDLRTLADAPTADVAAEPVASNVRGAADWLLYFYADPSHQGEDDQTAAAYWALGPELARKLIDAFRELARLRAAAPEGVDAATELHLRLRHVLGIDDDVIVNDDGLINDVGEWVRRARALGADVPAAAPEGMDLEAQGEMADQLAAAQAANQRVRAVLAQPWDVDAAAAIADAVERALDGDTTEES